ncbi:MAG: alanine racemase [bacterium]
MSKLQFMHNVYAEINLDALSHNFHQIKKLLLPKTKVMAVVKANAYGHGAADVARRLSFEGVDFLGVANFIEAVELREIGISLPILMLSEIPHEVVPYSLAYKLSHTVYTLALAKEISKQAQILKTMAKVHVKIDTGMNRVGVAEADAVYFIKKVISLPNIALEGIFTHFSQADDKTSPITREQIQKFDRIIKELRAEGISPPLIHAANSGGTLNFSSSHYDMVRVGLSLYGLYPAKPVKDISLKPLMSLKTRVAYLKKVGKGAQLGYGGTHKTKADTYIATLPVGYADGLPRILSNKGAVLIKGQRYPIVGRISMDLTLVDVGLDPVIKVGDSAVLIGQQGKEEITVDEVAKLENTISYEVTCRLGRRVPRIYK